MEEREKVSDQESWREGQERFREKQLFQKKLGDELADAVEACLGENGIFNAARTHELFNCVRRWRAAND